MRKSISVPPPENFSSFSPSELFRFYFQIGRWTEDSFSDDLQSFTRGKLVSTVTISKWKNKNVIPSRYSGAFLNLVESVTEPALAKAWTTAFETVWGLQSAGRTPGRAQKHASTISDAILAKHREWIAQLYSKKHPNLGYAPAELYVPLELENLEADGTGPTDIEDIIDLLNSTEDEPDWIFISGGPGAGKSMTALHLARELDGEDVCPIFLRGGRLSDIDMDITDPHQPIEDSFSVKSFLRHFRASSFKTACLVLDGLDEIGRGPQGPSHALSQFIAALNNERTACAAHSKKLWIIALGRDADIQFSAKQTPESDTKSFALRGLDGRVRGQFMSEKSPEGADLRAMWWQKYLAANGHVSDPSLPHFLSTEYDDFAEFGTDPLLTFLICQAALENSDDAPIETLPHERVNALTFASNRNEIYAAIVIRQAQNPRVLSTPKQLLCGLQHMALVMWQNEGVQQVSLKTIYDSVRDEETKEALRALGLTGSRRHSLPDILIAAFSYRPPQDDQETEQTVMEFTHSSFAEYLVSTLLFDRFTALVSALGQTDKFESALEDWTTVSTQGPHNPSLADFCQKEAALRFETLSKIDWDAALMIIRDHIQRGKHKQLGTDLVSEIQQSGSLLFFIWSCLNLERQKRTGRHFSLPQDGSQFNLFNLKAIQRPNRLNFVSGTLMEPTLRDLSFLSQSVSALHLKSADMSQLSFGLGHVENLMCEDTSFAMTHWSHVKISAARFTRIIFQQAIFHHWRAQETQFTDCLFQGSRFQGGSFTGCHLDETVFSQCHFSDVEFISSQFKNVVFDRCVFSECAFARGKDTDPPLNAQFRHCTFMGMDAALKNVPAENISDQISEIAT